MGALLGLLLVMAGCVSTEAERPNAEYPETPPDWITQPPQRDGYIFGLGSAANIDEARAMALVDAGQQFGVSIRVAIERYTQGSEGDESNELFSRMSEQLSDQRMFGARFADSWHDTDGTQWVLVMVPLDCVLDVTESYLISYIMEIRQDRPDIYHDIVQVANDILVSVEQVVRERETWRQIETWTSPSDISFIDVPAGSFQRDDDTDSITIITKPFRMSQHHITRSQFRTIMGTDPSINESSSNGENSPNDPVQGVNWYHAIAFCNKLSLQEGLTPVYRVQLDGVAVDWESLRFEDIPRKNHLPEQYDDWNKAEADWNVDGYRLPTEMEWMWAAMGADRDAQPDAIDEEGINRTGYDKPFAGYDGNNSIEDYVWYSENSDTNNDGNRTTQPGGTKLPNELGLFDMSGNCQDLVWDRYAYSARGETRQAYGLGPTNFLYAINAPVSDYRGAEVSSRWNYRVRRGGCANLREAYAVLSHRAWRNSQPYENSFVSFRVVRP